RPPAPPSRRRVRQAGRDGRGGAGRPQGARRLTALAEALRSGRFCYVVELVASALTREAKLLEVAARLARLPDVAAGSVTSYAGGSMGHDPMRVGTAARPRGPTPNVPRTCAGHDRAGR